MAALPDHALFTAVQACSENTLLEQTRLQTIVQLQMDIARELQAPTAKVDCPRQAWITEDSIGTGIFTSHFCNSAPQLSSRIGHEVQKGRLMVGRSLELKTALLEMRKQMHAKASINHWSLLAQPSFAKHAGQNEL